MWATWRGPPDPGRLSKLCESRAPCPRRFARRCGFTRWKPPPLRVGRQGAPGCRIPGTPAQTYRACKQVAVAASALAEEPFTAPATLTDRVRDQRSTALKCLA